MFNYSTKLQKSQPPVDEKNENFSIVEMFAVIFGLFHELTARAAGSFLPGKRSVISLLSSGSSQNALSSAAKGVPSGTETDVIAEGSFPEFLIRRVIRRSSCFRI